MGNFDDARVYLDGDELIIETADRKFVVPLGRFSEVML